MAVRSLARFRLAVAIAAAVLVLAGCEVRTDVDIAVQRDGGGTVSVSVVLDREAAARIPNLATQLRTDDLRRVGWAISGPERTRSGGFRVVARMAFTRPEQVAPIVEELTGKAGPLRGFALRRSHSFARTTYTTTGTVDLRAGIAAFSDPQVAALLGGQPLGRSEEALRQDAGRPLADAAPFVVTVHQPGGASRFAARLGGPPVAVDARSSVTRTSAYLLLALAVVVLAAAAASVSLERRWRRRLPRRLRGVGVYQRRPYETVSGAGEGRPPGVGDRR